MSLGTYGFDSRPQYQSNHLFTVTYGPALKKAGHYFFDNHVQAGIRGNFRQESGSIFDLKRRFSTIDDFVPILNLENIWLGTGFGVVSVGFVERLRSWDVLLPMA